MISFHPTPYPDLNDVLQDFVGGIHAVIQDNFVGFYLQGSFAVGDFDPDSDVDFIVVTEEELSAEEVEALQKFHALFFTTPVIWAQHLDGSYYPKAILKDPVQCGRPLWYLDNGHDYMVHSPHCNTIVVRWTVREHGISLAGPDPQTLIDPIPVEALRSEVLATMHDWGQEIFNDPERFNNRFYQGFIVLSYCRMLHTLHAGITGSKRAGAEWAKTHLDPSWAGLIDRAWATRPVPEVQVRTPADPEDFKATLEFVQYAIEEADKIQKQQNRSTRIRR